jgi:hypothetical protein
MNGPIDIRNVTMESCAEASGLTADLRAAHPDKDRWPTETLLRAAQHMLTAIDRGYFADPSLPESAFTQGLRDAVAREIAGRRPYDLEQEGIR